MSLRAGMKLAHYQILAPLGAGGMGEVYRARDARLERDVALKVLPATPGGLGRSPGSIRARGEGAGGRFSPQSRDHLRHRRPRGRSIRGHGTPDWGNSERVLVPRVHFH